MAKLSRKEIDALENQIEELNADSLQWKQFLEHPQWKTFETTIRAMIVTRKAEIDQLMSSPGLDSAHMRMCKDHEIHGLQLALAMPGYMMQDNEVTIRAAQDALAENEET